VFRSRPSCVAITIQWRGVRGLTPRNRRKRSRAGGRYDEVAVIRPCPPGDAIHDGFAGELAQMRMEMRRRCACSRLTCRATPVCRQRSRNCAQAVAMSCRICRGTKRSRGARLVAATGRAKAPGSWSRRTGPAKPEVNEEHQRSWMASNVVVIGTQWVTKAKGKVVELADRPRARRGPFQAGNNAGPHAGHRGAQADPAADPIRHPARRRQLLHRQRRGVVPAALLQENRRTEASASRAFTLKISRRLSADTRLSRGDRPGTRSRQSAEKIGPTVADRARLRGQGRAPRDRLQDLYVPGSIRETAPKCSIFTTSCWSIT